MTSAMRDNTGVHLVNGFGGEKDVTPSPPAMNGVTKATESIEFDGRNNANESYPRSQVNGTGGSVGNEAPPPIAIVGMGMRLPGRANSAATFWDLLVNKKDGRCRIPADRYNIDAFYSPSAKPGTVNVQHGYFLEDADLQHLDAAFFSMNQTEVEKLDPQQRMLLEVVYECMENAGQTNWHGDNIGCYVGVFGEDWLDLAAKDPQQLGVYRITGSGDFALANRVSYEYNLKGPRYCIQVICRMGANSQ